MVAIHYEFEKESASYIGDIQKPKQNYIIPIICLICLTGTFALIILYFYHNEELLPSLRNSRRSNVKRIVCYYDFPSSINETDLQPENIEADLCTHVVVGFLNVNETFELGVNEAQINVLKRLNTLKSKNDELKVLISVGGAGNSQNWPEMVFNHTNRKRFIRSVRIFLEMNLLDGVDLDWEYPNSGGVDNKQRIHFTQLLEEFRMHINRNSYKFLLCVAVPSFPLRVDESYQINYLNQFPDFINLMTYDYHFYSNLTPITGLNSPLIKSSLDNGIFATMNINYTVNYYLERGMDKSKINVGLPTYAHTFTLFNQYNNGLYSPAKSYGQLGSKGFASYSDVCKFLKRDRVMKVFDSVTRSPYATKGSEWVSYDDNNSLSLKAQFILAEGFGGVMIYSLNADDYQGICRSTFELIRAVKNVFHNED